MYGSRNDPRDGNEGVRQDTADGGATCSRIEPLLETFHDGALDAEQMRLVAEHVSTCRRCAAHLRRLEQIDRLIQSAPAPKPGPDLRRGLYARIQTAHSDEAVLWPPRWLMRRGAIRVPASASTLEVPPQATTLSVPRTGAEGPLPQPVHTPAGWFSGSAAVAVVVALALVFLSLPRHSVSNSGRGQAPTAQSAQTPRDGSLPVFHLPRFSDWRAAYLSHDGYAHVVSLDGSNDITGPAIPNISVAANIAATSPDGHWLAYITGPKVGSVVIANLATSASDQDATRLVEMEASGQPFWSPDSSRLAVATSGGVYLITASDAHPKLIVATQPGGKLQFAELVGWLDSSHLALLPTQQSLYAPFPTITPPSTSTAQGYVARLLSAPLRNPRSEYGPRSLVSVDVHSSAFASIASLPSGARVSLSPDGTEAFVMTECAAPCSVNPIAELIDTATGQIHQITSVTHASAITWEPVGPIVAATIFSSYPPSVALADLQQNTVQPLVASASAIGWSPDGQTLLLRSVGPGVSVLYALAPVQPGGHEITLTSSIQAFLGFVRTG